MIEGGFGHVRPAPSTAAFTESHRKTSSSLLDAVQPTINNPLPCWPVVPGKSNTLLNYTYDNACYHS
jgi:hypothetical protein